MSLQDQLDNPPTKPSGSPCSIAELERTLPPDEAAALRRILYELGWSQSQVYDTLLAEGHAVGRQTINRHRAGECRCRVSR